MGVFLNNTIAYDSFSELYNGKYFVDKSLMLSLLSQRIGITEKYICVTRPRRFGKSTMANMIAAFYSKACDSKNIFDNLKISKDAYYLDNINKYNVIFITLSRMPKRCKNYEQYIGRIEDTLIEDLKSLFPDVKVDDNDAVWDVLTHIYTLDSSNKFIFVLDEWDFIFHRDFVTDKDKADYIDFLSNLLKDQPYVQLAYMTGILPIAKYSSGSELNMFLEYTMATEQMFSEYFGFTEMEVDELYTKYMENQENPKVTRDGLRTWYNGYHTMSGERVYNPRSVVASLSNNNLGNYWTSSGPYDEIYYYINNNVAAVRDDLAQMVSGIPVLAKIQEYAATSTELSTKNEIFSAMVVYGFLSYENGYVSIPNKELMNKFNDMLMKEPSLGYVHSLAKVSEEMLKATLKGDENKVAEIMEYAHNTETPLLMYNSESELTVLVSLVYLSARDSYRVEREDKAGKGYVDFIFYPIVDKKMDAIILELKVDSSADDALKQIKDRNYALKFDGKIGQNTKYSGRVLGVGIAYDRKNKVHTCKIEVLREKHMVYYQ